MTSLHDDAVRVLAGFEHADPRQQALRDQYLDFLGVHRDAMWRSLAVGHLTASSLVMDASGEHVLLTLHPKVGRWLQLGGHCEPDDVSLAAAAHREVVEESGMPKARISPEPVRLDRHPVPCGGATSEHLDVQFLAVVADGSAIVMSEESDDLRWFGLDRLPADLDASVLGLIADAVRYHERGGEFFRPQG